MTDSENTEAKVSAEGFTVTITRSYGKDNAVVIFVDGPEEGPLRDHDEMPGGAPRCRILLNDEPVYAAVPYDYKDETNE